MELGDDQLNALWQQLRNRNDDLAPLDVVRAVSSLCGDRAPDALYCTSEEEDGRTVWRVLAVVSEALIDVNVSAPKISGRTSQAWLAPRKSRPERVAYATWSSRSGSLTRSHKINAAVSPLMRHPGPRGGKR